MKFIATASFLIFSLCGCAPISLETISHPGETFINQYTPTGSPCVNSYFTHSSREGCTIWRTRNIANSLVELSCTQTNDEASVWYNYTFIFFVNGGHQPPLNFSVICADFVGSLAVLKP